MKQGARVHRIVEHPAEFQTFDDRFGLARVGVDRFQRVPVLLRFAQVEQLGSVTELGGDVVEHDDDLFERMLLLAQLLGAGGVVPDRGVFEFAADRLQAFGLVRVVKDTPGGRARETSGRRVCWQSR